MHVKKVKENTLLSTRFMSLHLSNKQRLTDCRRSYNFSIGGFRDSSNTLVGGRKPRVSNSTKVLTEILNSVINNFISFLIGVKKEEGSMFDVYIYFFMYIQRFLRHS